MTALPLVRVRLKYPDVETFVERFAPNVTRGGIFLASREPKPVGAAVRFEVTLLGGAAVLTGEGRVTWVKPWNPAEPTRPHGMGVQFTLIDETARPVLARLLERKAANSGPRAVVPPGAADAVLAARQTMPRPSPVQSTEFDSVEDTALRRALDRARQLAPREADLDDLLRPDASEPPTLSQALAELPRFLQSKRGSGPQRTLATMGIDAGAPAAAPASEPSSPSSDAGDGANGLSSDPAPGNV